MALTCIWGSKLRRKVELDVSGGKSSAFNTQAPVGSLGGEIQWARIKGCGIKVTDKDLGVIDIEVVDDTSEDDVV